MQSGTHPLYCPNRSRACIFRGLQKDVNEWVRNTLGDKAEVTRREFAMMAKGLCAAWLRGVYKPEQLIAKLSKQMKGTTRYKFQLSKVL